MKVAKRIIIEIRRRVIYEPILINNVYNSRSEAFIITREILVTFYREALARGELPIIVLFPDRLTHGQYQKGHPIIYGPLRDYFQSNRIRYIDTLLKLGPESASTIFGSTHYSPKGNSLVSEAIEQYLEKERLQDLSNFQRIMESERTNFILHPSGRR